MDAGLGCEKRVVTSSFVECVAVWAGLTGEVDASITTANEWITATFPRGMIGRVVTTLSGFAKDCAVWTRRVAGVGGA